MITDFSLEDAERSAHLIENLTHENEQLHQQLQQLEQRLIKEQVVNEQLKLENEDSQQKLKAEHKKRKKIKKELHSSLERANKELEESKKCVAELEQQKTEFQVTTSELQQRIEEAEKTKNELTTQLEDATKIHHESEAKWKERGDVLEKQIESLEMSRTALLNQLQEEIAAKSAIQKQYNDLKANKMKNNRDIGSPTLSKDNRPLSRGTEEPLKQVCTVETQKRRCMQNEVLHTSSFLCFNLCSLSSQDCPMNQ